MEKENFSDFIEKIEEKNNSELAEFLLTEQPSKREAIKAVLDAKTIKNIQQLTKAIEDNNVKSEKYSNVLTKLTMGIFILTIVMTIATIISVFK